MELGWRLHGINLLVLYYNFWLLVNRGALNKYGTRQEINKPEDFESPVQQ